MAHNKLKKVPLHGRGDSTSWCRGTCVSPPSSACFALKQSPAWQCSSWSPLFYRLPLSPHLTWSYSFLSIFLGKILPTFVLEKLPEIKSIFKKKGHLNEFTVQRIFCRMSDKCRNINIHKLGNSTIRFLGRFTFSWRGMISRSQLQIELLRVIFKRLTSGLMFKAPFSTFCIVHDVADDVLGR